jgi:hypothetical protein
VDGIVYLFGGASRPSLCAQADVLAYDPVQDRFTTMRSLQAPTLVAGYAAIDGRIYIAGGVSGETLTCSGAVHHKTLWVFDPYGVPGSWTQKADMPLAVGELPGGCEVDGIFYVVGGDFS